MSKERARAREARVAARQAEVARAAEQREKAARRAARRSRFRVALPTPSQRALRALAIVLGVELVAWPFVTGVLVRVALAILTLAVLAVLTTARRSTSR